LLGEEMQTLRGAERCQFFLRGREAVAPQGGKGGLRTMKKGPKAKAKGIPVPPAPMPRGEPGRPWRRNPAELVPQNRETQERKGNGPIFWGRIHDEENHVQSPRTEEEKGPPMFRLCHEKLTVLGGEIWAKTFPLGAPKNSQNLNRHFFFK